MTVNGYLRYLFCMSLVTVGLLLYSCDDHECRPVPNPPPKAVDSLRIGLIAYYPFTGNAGDSSGNAYHGLINNVSLAPDRFGKPNSAYYFNGIDAYIDLGNATALKRYHMDFTLSAWVNTDASSQKSHTIIGGRNNISENNEGSVFAIGNTAPLEGIIQFGVRGGSKGSDVYSATLINDGEWHFVAVTYKYNGDTTVNEAKIYIDGISDAIKSDMNYLLNPATTHSYIGYDPPANVQNIAKFQGYIDELRIYGRVLTDGEIGKLYKLKK